jgi:hypothetical protein
MQLSQINETASGELGANARIEGMNAQRAICLRNLKRSRPSSVWRYRGFLLRTGLLAVGGSAHARGLSADGGAIGTHRPGTRAGKWPPGAPPFDGRALHLLLPAQPMSWRERNDRAAPAGLPHGQYRHPARKRRGVRVICCALRYSFTVQPNPQILVTFNVPMNLTAVPRSLATANTRLLRRSIATARR